MRSCARRSFEAATIFIALVICCVDLTARTRRRISRSDGIVSSFQLVARSFSSASLTRHYSAALRCSAFPSRGERVAEFLERLVQVGLDLIVDLLLLRERRQQLAPSRVERLEQIRLVGIDLIDLDAV